MLVFAAKRDIRFESKDGTSLSGTIYLPKGQGPFPAIVFVHGSGKETRKNNSYSAKWLSSLGYVTLIYDKRGVGKSEGDQRFPDRFSFEILAEDVVAAVTFLSDLDEVDDNSIGLHASSQGGWVAPLACSMTDEISFMIIKSGSVTTVEEDRIFERRSRLIREGFSDQDLEEVRVMQLTEPRHQDGSDRFYELFDENKSKAWFKRVYPVSEASVLDDYRSWYTTIASFDPLEYLGQIDVPIFWIFGDESLDRFAPLRKSKENLSKLSIGGKNYTIRAYDGETHNVSERKYEKELYEWLRDTNSHRVLPFKRH